MHKYITDTDENMIFLSQLIRVVSGRPGVSDVTNKRPGNVRGQVVSSRRTQEVRVRFVERNRVTFSNHESPEEYFLGFPWVSSVSPVRLTSPLTVPLSRSTATLPGPRSGQVPVKSRNVVRRVNRCRDPTSSSLNFEVVLHPWSVVVGVRLGSGGTGMVEFRNTSGNHTDGTESGWSRTFDPVVTRTRGSSDD